MKYILLAELILSVSLFGIAGIVIAVYMMSITVILRWLI